MCVSDAVCLCSVVGAVDASEDSMESSEEMVTPRAEAWADSGPGARYIKAPPRSPGQTRPVVGSLFFKYYVQKNKQNEY